LLKQHHPVNLKPQLSGKVILSEPLAGNTVGNSALLTDFSASTTLPGTPARITDAAVPNEATPPSLDESSGTTDVVEPAGLALPANAVKGLAKPENGSGSKAKYSE